MSSERGFLNCAPGDDLNVPLEEDDDIERKLNKHIADSQNQFLDLELDALPQAKWTQLSEYKNPRFLADEEFLTSRVVLTLEYLRFGKIHRRNPTEVAFRLTFQSGIWLTLRHASITVHLEAIGSHQVGDRTVPPKVQIAASTPDVKPLPEPPAPWESQTSKEENWEEKEPGSERDDKYLWKGCRDKYSIRYESVGSNGRDEDDQVCQTLPIYVRLKHVGTFAFRFLLSLTYAPSSDLAFERSLTVNNEITKLYDWAVFFDKDVRPPGLNLWENAEKDIKAELQDSGIEMWETRALEMSRMKRVEKSDIEMIPEASGSGSGSGSGEEPVAGPSGTQGGSN